MVQQIYIQLKNVVFMYKIEMLITTLKKFYKFLPTILI